MSGGSDSSSSEVRQRVRTDLLHRLRHRDDLEVQVERAGAPGVREANSQTNWSAWEVWVPMSASHALAYAMRTWRCRAAGIRRRDIWLGALIEGARSNIQSRGDLWPRGGAATDPAPGGYSERRC